MFQEKAQNHKGHVYLKNCSIVTQEQIVRMAANFCRFTRIKTTPAKYDKESGKIIGIYNALYVKVGVPLGEHWKELDETENEDRLRCLTHAFLTGEIFENFRKLSDKWLSPPAG